MAAGGVASYPGPPLMRFTDGEVEVLFQYGQSKEVLKILPKDFEAYVKAKLPITSAQKPNLLPYDACPPVKGNYILQKWSERWKCYVDAGKEIEDGDRLIVVECDCEVSYFYHASSPCVATPTLFCLV